MLHALVSHDRKGKRDLEELDADDVGDQEACYEKPACMDRGRWKKKSWFGTLLSACYATDKYTIDH